MSWATCVHSEFQNTLLTLSSMLLTACFGDVFSNSMGFSPTQRSRRNSCFGLRLRRCHFILRRQLVPCATGSAITTSATQVVKTSQHFITYTGVRHRRRHHKSNDRHHSGVLLAWKHTRRHNPQVRIDCLCYNRLHSNPSHRHHNMGSCTSAGQRKDDPTHRKVCQKFYGSQSCHRRCFCDLVDRRSCVPPGNSMGQSCS